VGRQPAGHSGPDGDLAARAQAWAEQSRKEQGLPAKVTDPRTIANVVEVLAQARQTAVKREPSKRLKPRRPGPTTT
jgi:hypothetical protein